MDKYPAFQCYAMDERVDEKRLHWTAQQWGWFTLLRMHAWGQSPQGKFRNEDRTLKAVTKWQPGDNEKDWSDVISYFKREGKFLVDHELIRQVNKMRKFSKIQSTRAKKRWHKDGTTAKKVQWNGKTYWPTELEAVCDKMEEDIIAHRKKKPTKGTGPDSHNICYI
jgi:hypothetical protein